MLRTNMHRLALLCVLLSAWLLPQPLFVPQTVAAETNGTADDALWTRWHPDQYALVKDGPALWIGAAGSLIRWDKSSQTYRRYGPLDGLPQGVIYATAVTARATTGLAVTTVLWATLRARAAKSKILAWIYLGR